MKTILLRHHRPSARRAAGMICIAAAALSLLVLPASPDRAQGASREKPSLNISVSPSRVWPGESCLLRVQVRNVEGDVNPDLGYLDGEFDVEYMGSEPLSHSMTITINGKTTVTEERGETFVYRLTPKRGGTIQIEPPIVESDGVPLNAPPAMLRVVEPEDANLPPQERLARLETTVSPEAIYPLSTFTVTLSVYVREDSDKKKPTDPLRNTGDRNPPELFFDWALDENIPQGIAPDEEFSEWLEGYVDSRGGFSINRLRQNNPFSLLGGDPRLLTFLPRGELVQSGGEGAPRFWRYDFTRSFTAGDPGTYSMPPARLKGYLGGREIYAASNPLAVTVREVPQPRPDGYVGVVGDGADARLDAHLSSGRGRVGEALTLELTLTGTKGAVDLRTPDLAAAEPLKKRFKIYAPNEERYEGAVRWRWNLRPLAPGGEAFPSVTLSCFDAAGGKFRDLRTDEIPLTIEAGSADLESFVQDESSAETEEPAGRAAGPKPLGRIPTLFSLGEMALFAGAVYAAVGAFGLIRHARRRRAADSSGAAQRAGTRLLRKAFAEGTGAVHHAVATAFLAPLTAGGNRRAGTLSRGEIDELLAEWIKDAPSDKFKKLAGEFAALLDRLEAEQFAGADASVTEAQVEELYRRWTGALNERPAPRRKKNPVKTLGLLLIPFLLALTGCRPDDRTREEFDRAVSLYARAEASDAGEDEKARLFRQAAAAGEGLLAEGKENGAILYNLGRAYRGAGDLPRALAAWRRAERYIPTDKELKAAIAEIKPNDSAEKRGFLDAVLFWRRLISHPAQEKIFLGLTLAAALSAFAALFAPAPRRRALRSFAAAFFLISLVQFGSLSLDRYQEARRGIATAETELRKGNGAAYDPVARLRELDECRVLEAQPGWFRVRTPDGVAGWVASDKLLVR